MMTDGRGVVFVLSSSLFGLKVSGKSEKYEFIAFSPLKILYFYLKVEFKAN